MAITDAILATSRRGVAPVVVATGVPGELELVELDTGGDLVLVEDDTRVPTGCFVLVLDVVLMELERAVLEVLERPKEGVCEEELDGAGDFGLNAEGTGAEFRGLSTEKCDALVARFDEDDG